MALDSKKMNIVQDVSDCAECNDLCKEAISQSCSDTDEPKKATGMVLGLSLTFFLVMFVISIALLIFMIWFSVHVLKKCKGKPSWLNPTVITLLVLWLLIGWFPGLGLVLFVALLVILIIYNNKCKKK
jgi:hypothetical protein